MKIVRYQIIYAILLGLLCSCGGINKVLKSKDPDYKYEVAKQCYMNGKYENASMESMASLTFLENVQRDFPISRFLRV